MSTKISQLTSATDVTASDLMQIVDVEDGVMAPSGTNKKVTASLLAKELAKQPLEPGIVISGSSSGDAVRITQTGSGNALVVEDSTNPDADPIVISNDGRMYVGYTQNIVTPVGSPKLQVQAGASFIRHSSSFAPRIDLARSDSDTIGTHVAVQNGDGIGEIAFCGSDGTNYITGATISSGVDGTPGVNDMPGRLTFSTTADGSAVPSERMRITSAGNVGIGTGAPTAKLNVVDNSSSDALRITQTGSGNALVVEDSTNPDSTPFVVDTNGRVVVGDVMSRTGPYGFPRGLQITNVGAQLTAAVNNQFGEGLTFVKSRGTPSSPHTIVQNGDSLGTVAFTGSDGSDYVLGSQISSFVDGTPGSDDMPSRLTFFTSADGTTGTVERMRITSAGNVGIGTVTPSSKLHVAGDLTMSSATVATSATAGTNGDVPAQVEGYLVVNINGTARKIPYYA